MLVIRLGSCQSEGVGGLELTSTRNLHFGSDEV